MPLWQIARDVRRRDACPAWLRDEHGRLWRGGVAKFFIDGVIDTGTGWLYEPDTLGDGTEPFWPDPERYAEAVKLFAQAGFQCVTHATGDRGVRAALDAYLAAGAPARRAPPDRAHRDAHRRRPRPLRARGRRGVDAAAAHAVAARRQQRLVGRTARYRSGPRVRFAPPICCAPAPGWRWAPTGRSPRTIPAWAWRGRGCGERRVTSTARVFEPDQRLSGLDTLHGYTTAAAATVGERDLGGRIIPGLRGDLTVFAEDPVDISADDLPAAAGAVDRGRRSRGSPRRRLATALPPACGWAAALVVPGLGDVDRVSTRRCPRAAVRRERARAACGGRGRVPRPASRTRCARSGAGACPAPPTRRSESSAPAD